MKPLLFALAVMVTSTNVAAQDASIRRYALIVGVNSGGPSRAPLRYAESDAAAFGSLLSALGGVTAEDKMLLVEPTRASLEAGIDALRARMSDRTGATRVELIVYYSGHSDETGLMLGTDKMSYTEFRSALQTLPADVRIAILDSCQSGALTRRKGGTMRAPFLFDASTQVRGQAILTSSSETESAQESDRIRGSFFTHYLLSGLRGAADVTHDRRVTLNEAYQFAFAETLARTEGTKFGPQHPAYEIELAGSGDVVMTDLRATSSTIVIDDTINGRVFIRDSEGHLVAELYKAPGRSVEIGVAPGEYSVRVEQKDARQLLEGNVIVADLSTTTLTPQMLRAGRLEIAQRRGSEEELGEPGENVLRIPFAFSLWPGAPPWPPADAVVSENFHLSIVYGQTDYLRGAALGLGATRVRRHAKGAQVSVFLSFNDGGGEGGQVASFYTTLGGPFVGLQAAGIYASADKFSGLQVASVATRSGDFYGLQAGGIAAWSDNSRGLQTGGVAAISKNKSGLQVAGVTSIARGYMHGFQTSSTVNVATGDVRGLQLSLVNIGGDVSGAQIGLVNVAKVVHGTQIGLVNVADDVHGVPFGLFSYIKNQGLGAEVWTGTTEPINVALRYDTHHTFYTFLALGMFSLQDVTKSDAYYGIGLGAHLAKSGNYGFDFDVAALYPSLDFKNGELLVRQRASFVYDINPTLSAFAGITWSQYMGWGGEDNRTIASSFLASEHHSRGGDFTLRTWPSLHLGLRI